MKNKGINRFVNKRILILLALFLVWEVLLLLNKQGRITIPPFLITSSRFIVATILAFLVTSVIIRLTSKKIYHLFTEDVEIEQRLFISKLYQIFLYFLAIMFILYYVGVSLGNLTLFLGLITTGLALSLQNVILGVVVWMILLTKKPFRIGDYIKIGDDEGKVVHIGTFFTTIDIEWASRKKAIKIPNKVFIEKSVENFGSIGVKETIKMHLSKVPANLESRMTRMAAEVRKHTVKEEEISIVLDTDGKDYFFVIRYFIDVNKCQETRSSIIAKLYAMNKDIMGK